MRFHIVEQVFKVGLESPSRCPLTNLNTLSDLYKTWWTSTWSYFTVWTLWNNSSVFFFVWLCDTLDCLCVCERERAYHLFIYHSLMSRSGVQWPVTLCPLIKNNPPLIIHDTWQILMFFRKSLSLCNVSPLQCTQLDAIDSVCTGVQRLFFLCNAVWKRIFLYTSGHEFYDVVLVCVYMCVCSVPVFLSMVSKKKQKQKKLNKT